MGLSDGEIKAFHDIDLFFNPTISLYPNFFLDTPFVFTLHDFQERYYPSFFSKIDRVKRWLVKRTLATSAKHIVCESNYVKKDVLFFLKVDEAKVSVIPSPPTSLISNFYFDNDITFGDNEIPGQPSHFYNAELRYDQKDSWFVAMNMLAASKADTDFNNTHTVPGYAIIGTGAGYDVNKKVSLFFEGKNLLNKKYISNFTAAATNTDASSNFYGGDLRRFFGGVRVTFN